MLYKYLFTDRLSRAHKLCILVAVAVPLAIAAGVLAWIRGNLGYAIFYDACALGWSVLVTTKAWKIYRRRDTDKIRLAVVRTLRRRRMMVLERTLWLLVLMGGIASLVKALASNAAFYLVLWTVWLIIVGGGHFLFVRPVTDE